MAEKLTATKKWLMLLDEIASDGSDFSPYEQELRIARKVTPGYFAVALAALRAEKVEISEEAETAAAHTLNISNTNRQWAAQAMSGQIHVELTLGAIDVRSHNPEMFAKFTGVIMEHVGCQSLVEREPVLEAVA